MDSWYLKPGVVRERRYQEATVLHRPARKQSQQKEEVSPCFQRIFWGESFCWLLTKWNKASVLWPSSKIACHKPKASSNFSAKHLTNLSCDETPWSDLDLQYPQFGYKEQLGVFFIEDSFQSLRFMLFHEKWLGYTFNTPWLSSGKRLNRTSLLLQGAPLTPAAWGPEGNTKWVLWQNQF